MAKSGGGSRGGSREYFGPVIRGATRTRRVSGGSQGQSYTERTTRYERRGRNGGRVTVASVTSGVSNGQRIYAVRDISGRVVGVYGTSAAARRAANELASSLR